MANRTALLAGLLLGWVTSFAYSQTITLLDLGQTGYAKTSVNSVVFRSSSICSDKEYQYVSWYDGEGYMTVAMRKLNSTDWSVQKSAFKGNVADAHNTISMAVDGDGYLHISFDHHGNALNYAKSIKPHSIEFGPKTSMTGHAEGKVTYPEFFQLPDGNLLFMYRDGESGNGNLILNRYDTKENKWSQVQPNLIDGEGKRNAYWQAAMDTKGTFHLSWVWRETGDVASNHDLSYAKSTDGGLTWTKSDGTQYKMPIRLTDAEVACNIPQKSDLMNQTSMVADTDGKPYIATYFRGDGDKAPQYYIVSYDGKKWNRTKVLNRTLDFHLAGGGTKRVPISRPLVVAKTVNGIDHAYLIFRDEERGNKVSMAICDDLKKQKWTATDLTSFPVGMWEPTHDPQAWQLRNELDLYIQNCGQGDGEKQESLTPQPIKVLVWKP